MGVECYPIEKRRLLIRPLEPIAYPLGNRSITNARSCSNTAWQSFLFQLLFKPSLLKPNRSVPVDAIKHVTGIPVYGDVMVANPGQCIRKAVVQLPGRCAQEVISHFAFAEFTGLSGNCGAVKRNGALQHLIFSEET